FEKPDSSSAATAPTIESTKPVETSAIEPVTDASQASIPVQLSAPVDAPTQMFIPAQSAVVTTEASALGSEPAAQSASTPVPAAQESQVQQ
ncbi:MAG: hypothetical protein Q7S42_04185, partial [Candidatus Omnitrophota bacterium]|nr:hypothetical protein [Candidatus Omnitrophota bacterium]